MNSTNNTDCVLVGGGAHNLIIIIALIIVIVCGFLGNVAIVYVILRHNHLRTLTNLIIASISVGSIISTSICSPIDLYRLHWGYQDWKLSSFVCKTFWLLEMGTNITFALHIALFAIYRLKTILNPYKVIDVSRVKLVICMSLLWFLSFALAIPALYYARVRETGQHVCYIASCSIRKEDGEEHHYVTMSFFVIFSLVYIMIVMTSLTFCCFSFCGKSSNPESDQSESQPKEMKKESTRDGTFSRGIEMSKAFADYKNSSIRGRTTRKMFVSKQQKENFIQFLFILSSFLIGYTPIVVFVMLKLINNTQNSNLYNEPQQYSTKWTNLFTRVGEFLFFITVMCGTKKLRKPIGMLLKSIFYRN